MNTNRKKNHRNGHQQLRIIGGKWRGRKLQFPDISGLRPTGDRIRETLFNWLAAEITQAYCLDVFSGSGAIGFEALSRGAKQVTLLEKHPLAAQALQDHKERLQAENMAVFQTDALTWLAQKLPATSFNLVILDPPFSEDLLQPAIQLLEENDWLSTEATIYIETAAASPPPIIPSHWLLKKSKTQGQVRYQLFTQSHKD